MCGPGAAEPAAGDDALLRGPPPLSHVACHGNARVPGTAHCDEIGAAIAADLGMPVAGFSVNGDGGATSSAAMVEAALLDVADRDIVLAHMNRRAGGPHRAARRPCRDSWTGVCASSPWTRRAPSR